MIIMSGKNFSIDGKLREKGLSKFYLSLAYNKDDILVGATDGSMQIYRENKCSKYLQIF